MIDLNDRYLYEAKRTDNGEWVEGYLFRIWEEAYILWGTTNDVPNTCKIDSSTLCQCTGTAELYEHDIFHLGDENIRYEVVWHDTGFMGKQLRGSSYAGLSYWSDKIVIMGNRYDNPELLEV